MSTNLKPNQSSALDKLDTIGACVSFACAIHCVAMPFLLTLLPLLGLGVLAHSVVDSALFTITIGLAAISLCWGMRVHRRWQILSLLVAALILFWMAGFSAHDTDEAILVGIGGVCLAVGHLLNRKLCRSCVHCSHQH